MCLRLKKYLQKICALTMLVIVVGCASVQTPIDWFAEKANTPERVSLVDGKFCLSVAVETADARIPQGYFWQVMNCGSDLSRLKQQLLNSCHEKTNKVCMPVYYFDREKHDVVQDFESENISRKQQEANQRQLQIQAQQRQQLQEQCKGYGFISGTPSMAKCVMEIDIAKRQVEERQAKLNSERASRVKDCNMKKAFEIAMASGRNTGEENFQRCMSGLPPAPKLEVNCINIGGGQVRCTSQ